MIFSLIDLAAEFYEFLIDSNILFDPLDITSPIIIIISTFSIL